MRGEWASYERRVQDLVATAAESDEPAIEGEMGWLPLQQPLARRIEEAAERIPSTPVILWDLDILVRRTRELAAVFGKFGITLNFAMKACSTTGVLSRLADLGVGCDVASMFEFEIARQLAFREITACGPMFQPKHNVELNSVGALVDTSSIHQTRVFLAAPTTQKLGLRLRVPMPSALLSPTTRGADSRFGVPLSAQFVSELRASRVPIRRLRVHTGESTSRTLLFRAIFALTTATLFDTVQTVNLGGGFLRLARRPEALEKALQQLSAVLEDSALDRRYRLTAEPGGALVLDHAYLVTEVLEVDEHPIHGRVVTVDASAWNCAPWAKTSFHTLASNPVTSTMIVGPSLYEQDAFSHLSGVARHRFPLGPCRPGDRLIATSVGAYAMTNGRSFNCLPLPAEYCLIGEEIGLLHGPLSFGEQNATYP
jgi:diaminopimelate decarboxylase